MDLRNNDTAGLLNIQLIELDVVYCAYAVSIADEVLRGEMTARNGFKILSSLHFPFIWLEVSLQQV